MSVQHRTDAYDSSDPGAAHITRLFDDRSLTFRTEQQPPGGEQNEGCEWIGDPLNAFDEREPGENRQRPEHEGAGDAKEQHASLILGGNVKFGEDDDEDEDVVDRQRLLEQVRREIFRRGASTVSAGDPQPYRKPQSDPHDDPCDVSGRRVHSIRAWTARGWSFRFRGRSDHRRHFDEVPREGRVAPSSSQSSAYKKMSNASWTIPLVLVRGSAETRYAGPW